MGMVNNELRDRFIEQGYAGPVRVFSAQECQRFLANVSGVRRQPPADWDKGHAVNSREFYEAAAHPAIMETVCSILGEDVLLWGASIQTRAPGAVHRWHTDVETSTASGTAVSVWIGLEHATPDSSLSVIPYSHLLGVTVQEMARHSGKRRRQISDEDVLRWAAERDPRCGIIKPEMADGDALFFDGELWHGSNNLTTHIRQALLLQYATPTTPIRIPDLNYLEWPARLLNVPRPGCIMLKGSGKVGINRMVPPPTPPGSGSRPQLSNRIYPLSIPRPPDIDKGWKPYPIFKGSTPGVQALSCHVSVLSHNQCPHPPHRHQEEEILLVLSGEVDIILPDLGNPDNDGRMRLKPGQFVYYPAGFAHTLTTVSQEPANYLMFKWQTGPSGAGAPLAFGHFNVLGQTETGEKKGGFRTRLLFEGPTACLQKLHCHTSILAPGAGYEPHVDAHDVAIIILEGEVETLGERVRPHNVIFYPAGEPHGMHNPGATAAKYVVFEFHGGRLSDRSHASPPQPSLLAKLADPQRWRRGLKHLSKRIRNASA
jgi:uncharacterized cupin superfamily protein